MLKPKIVILGSMLEWQRSEWQKAAKELGLEVALVSMLDVVWEINEETEQAFFYNSNGKKHYFKNYDILIRRSAKPYHNQAMELARYMQSLEKLVINSRLERWDKVAQALLFKKNNLPFPKSWQFFSQINLKKFLHKSSFPLIVKHIMGTKGNNIYKVHNQAEALSILKDENLGDYLWQEYLPANEDFRVIVVGDRCLGAMKRIVPTGDFRSNIEIGGTPKKVELTEEMQQLAQKSARAMGYEICGVDIIYSDNKPYILEVNRTPIFEAFTKTLKISVAEEILNYVIGKWIRKNNI